MKAIRTMAAQGDCLFRLLDDDEQQAFDELAKVELPPSDGRAIVGHSETGHHHAIDVTVGVTMFRLTEGDPNACYLRLEGVEYVDVVHHRPFDTHETLRLLATPGKTTVFEVRRQQEYWPSGWQRVHD